MRDRRLSRPRDGEDRCVGGEGRAANRVAPGGARRPYRARRHQGPRPERPVKNNGVQWLDEIPARWQVKRLRHISPSLGVGVVVIPSQYISDEGLPFLYDSDISEGRIHAERSRRISREDSDRLPKSQLHPDDLVMVRVGAPGVTAVVTPDLNGSNWA